MEVEKESLEPFLLSDPPLLREFRQAFRFFAFFFSHFCFRSFLCLLFLCLIVWAVCFRSSIGLVATAALDSEKGVIIVGIKCVNENIVLSVGDNSDLM